MKFCRKALNAYNKEENKDEAPKYVFVIDEINRGDLSKIFGELFFSIDPGYRGEKGRVKTQYCRPQCGEHGLRYAQTVCFQRSEGRR